MLLGSETETGKSSQLQQDGVFIYNNVYWIACSWMFESVIAKPIFVIFLNDDLDMLHADTKPQGLKKSSEN